MGCREWLRLVLLCGCLFLLVGCRSVDSAGRVETAFGKPAPIQGGTKDVYSNRTARMSEVINALAPCERDRLVEDLLRERARIHDATVSKFYWGTALDDLMRRGRWDLAEQVFASVSVEDISLFAPEYVVGSHGISRLVVMCDAYERAKTDRVRDGLATCFRRAFPREGDSVCDRVLVGRCKAMLPFWEGRELNNQYQYLPSGNGGPEGLLLEVKD